MDSRDLPALDAHAHIATDVTPIQVQRLRNAVVFCMTRSLSEAGSVPHGSFPGLVWGVGTHPADRLAEVQYSGNAFQRILTGFALVGEVGLDRRAGAAARQEEVLADILFRSARAPVLVSLHSTGAIGQMLSLIEESRVRAPILHWFGGDAQEIARAVRAGAWFSVNVAMKDEVIASMPQDRVLTETDYPHTRRAGSAFPGAVEPVEARLAGLWKCSRTRVREQVWENLRGLTRVSGAAPHLPKTVRDLLEGGRKL